MPQDKSNALLRTQVGEPIPGKYALDGHDKLLLIRGHGFEKGFRSSFHIAVEQDFPVVVHEADIHGARMQINATVKGVLVGVESHEVFSSFMSDFCPRSAYHWGMRRGEASIIINRVQATAYSLRFAPLHFGFQPRLTRGVRRPLQHWRRKNRRAQAISCTARSVLCPSRSAGSTGITSMLGATRRRLSDGSPLLLSSCPLPSASSARRSPSRRNCRAKPPGLAFCKSPPPAPRPSSKPSSRDCGTSAMWRARISSSSSVPRRATSSSSPPLLPNSSSATLTCWSSVVLRSLCAPPGRPRVRSPLSWWRWIMIQ